MNRIYHHYEAWEDYPAGFYDNISGKNKQEMIKSVIELFSAPEKTEKLMREVVLKWPNSCEHNLTNPAMNRVAYLGQAACCINAGVPCTVTMEAWNLVPKEYRDIADSIAEKIIKEWEVKYA